MCMHHSAALALPCACTTLRKASRAVSRAYDAALAPAGVTSAQFAVLGTLARTGQLPLSRLAEQLVMDRTSLYRALTPMRDAGWLQVEAGRGRAKLVALGDEGRRVLQAATPRWEAAQRGVVERLGVERWETLQEGLAALTAAGVAAARAA